MSGTQDTEALRAVIRDVLREIVPAAAARAAARGAVQGAEDAASAPVVEEVTIAGDGDLQAFVARLLRLCDEAGGREALHSGRHRFRLRAGRAVAVAPADGRPQRVDAGVLSESKVIALARGGRQVTLGKRVVVTPLARDKARQLGLKLEREK